MCRTSVCDAALRRAATTVVDPCGRIIHEAYTDVAPWHGWQGGARWTLGEIGRLFALWLRAKPPCGAARRRLYFLHHTRAERLLGMNAPRQPARRMCGWR